MTGERGAPRFEPDIDRLAVVSECGRYRYSLIRRWRPEGPVAVFCLCNPSTADALQDDATVRKCRGFAKLWGCAALQIVNPVAWRARQPKVLRAVEDTVGPENRVWVRAAATNVAILGGPFVVGWGAALPRELRPAAWAIVRKQVTDLVAPQCLGFTAEGQPRHPLMLPYSTPLAPFNPGETNMYDCLLCPRCGSKHRWPTRAAHPKWPSSCVCDDCGFVEPLSPENQRPRAEA